MGSNIIAKYLKALRFSEVGLMTGFFVIGSLFSISSLDNESIFKLIIYATTSFSLILSIYCYNAGAGSKIDKNNLRLKNLQTIKGNTFYKLSFVFFSTSIALGFLFNHLFVVLVPIIFIIWIVYSHPIYGVKHRPIWGTIIHFISQILHFNLGYSVYKSPCQDSLFISIIFAISFSVGHLLHEIIDYNSDKESGSKTSAVVFGIKKTGKTALILTIVNILIFVSLFYFRIIDNIILLSFSLPLLSQAVLFGLFISRLEINAIFIRKTHRIVFLLGGIIFVLLKMHSLV